MGTGAPSGTVTFLFTDIEGSTRLWQHDEEAMRAALERHDSILRSVIEGGGGYVFSTGGDGFAAAFARAGNAVSVAIDAQRDLAAELWPSGTELRVRMGLHTGEVTERDGDYFGTPVNRTARLMALGHGGQVLCSVVTAGLADGEATLVDLGEHRLRDLSGAQQVFQVGSGRFLPLRSVDAVPTNLPTVRTQLIGRRDDIAALTALVGGTELSVMRERKRASSIHRLMPALVGYLVAFAIWAGTTDLQNTLEAHSAIVENDEIVRRMTSPNGSSDAEPKGTTDDGKKGPRRRCSFGHQRHIAVSRLRGASLSGCSPHS